MKKYLFLSIALFGICSVLFSAFSKEEVSQAVASHIEWVGLEKAVQLAKTNPKPIIIDVYTDWCKWCRVMDESTYSDPTIIEYVNTHFYAVKLNAEQKEAIQFQGKNYNYVARGTRGVNEVVLAMVGNRPSYPSTVLLDDNMQVREILKGYKKGDAFLGFLEEFVGNSVVSR